RCGIWPTTRSGWRTSNASCEENPMVSARRLAKVESKLATRGVRRALKRAEIATALDRARRERLGTVAVDARWLEQGFVLLYLIAAARGDLTNARRALEALRRRTEFDEP